MKKKEELKEMQYLNFRCPQQKDNGDHLARQEEGDQHPEDDCISTILPSAASEKKWKIQ